MDRRSEKKFKLIRYEADEQKISDVIAIAYGRYSTDNQLSSSTEDQLRGIARSVERAQVKSLLFPNAKIEIRYELKDDAISGFGSVGRAGLDQALSLLRSGKAQIIIVHNFKRFIRGMGPSMTLYDFLQEHGAELISVSEEFSSAEKGARLKFMGKALASEEFLEAVSIDTKRGLDERRYEGFSDGHLWFGVGSRPTRQIEVKGKLKDSYFEYYIIAKLADLVHRIFQMAKDGHSTKATAKIFNDEGIPAPPCYDRDGNVRATKKAYHWRDRVVWGILNNKAYIGILERAKSQTIRKSDGTKQVISRPRSEWIVMEREDLRIVPQDLWDAVRDRIKIYHEVKTTKKADGRPFKYDGTTNHVLTGICKCGDCGGGFVVVSGRHGGRYGCPGAWKLGRCDNKKTISWRKIEPPILAWISEQLQDEAVYGALAQKYNEQKKHQHRTDFGELKQKEIKFDEISLGVANIVKNIEQGMASQALNDRLAQLESEKQVLGDKIKYLRGLDKSQVFMTPAAIKAQFAQVPALLMTAEPFQLNRAFKPLFRGSNGIKIEKRPSPTAKNELWATGSMNIGKVIGISRKISGDAILCL